MNLRQLLKKWEYSRLAPSEVFDRIYRERRWGNVESVSGQGSGKEMTATLRENLPQLFEKLDVKSILDLPCGDFHWMQEVDLNGIHYHGGDIVPELISKNNSLYASQGRSFSVLDLMSSDLPAADLLIVRDCLVHLSFSDIEQALANIRRHSFKWILMTHFPYHSKNKNIVTGEWRFLNCCLPPVNMPAPKQLLDDFSEAGKYLALWEV